MGSVCELQWAELQLLLSMFPSEKELEVTDQEALAELRGAVERSWDSPPAAPPAPHPGPHPTPAPPHPTPAPPHPAAPAPHPTPPPSSRPQFLLKQRIDKLDVTLCCTYPSDYPNVLPEINVRCTGLTRSQQTRLQADLMDHLQESCRGDVCVLSALEWVKDHGQGYVVDHLPSSSSSSSSAGGVAGGARSPPVVAVEGVFTRLWIYSHHIYNKSKRRDILDWSKELALTGFSMPGKPGVVCVEGPQGACDEFWSRVKALNWKRIMIRHREDVALDGGRGQGEEEEKEEGGGGVGVASLRKFSGFEEASFDPHGNRGNHMDLGLLYRFLSERGCSDVFQMFFGVEGQ